MPRCEKILGVRPGKRIKLEDPEKARARELLHGMCKSGTTVFTILRSVSRSGMSRRIDLYVIENNRPIRISYSVAKFLGYSINDNGVRVDGCGMDMGFHLVHNLSYALHGMAVNDPKAPFRSGYTLRQEWL